MFGLFYSLFVSAGCVVHKHNEYKENQENKIKYRHPDGLTYVDTKGQSRLISNDEIVFYTWKNGDYVLERMNGIVIKNFSAEKRHKQVEENEKKAIAHKETTYCIDENTHEKERCKGKRFKDFATGDIYVIRCLNYTYWYLNIDTGMIVRKTDWQLKHDEKSKNSPAFCHNPEQYDRMWHVDVDKINNRQLNKENLWEFYLDYKFNDNCNIYK